MLAKNIPAIPTTFNGVTYRSRLEARYAVMFHAAGIKYEYEPEGFTFPISSLSPPPEHGTVVCYLPDFRLYNIKNHPVLYVEIKPESFKDSADINEMRIDGVKSSDFWPYVWMLERFSQHVNCHTVLFIGAPDIDSPCNLYIPNDKGGPGCYPHDPRLFGDLIKRAHFDRARSAKFEHGKNGTP